MQKHWVASILHRLGPSEGIYMDESGRNDNAATEEFGDKECRIGDP